MVYNMQKRLLRNVLYIYFCKALRMPSAQEKWIVSTMYEIWSQSPNHAH